MTPVTLKNLTLRQWQAHVLRFIPACRENSLSPISETRLMAIAGSGVREARRDEWD